MGCGCNFIDQDLRQKFPVFKEQWIDRIMYGTEREKKRSLQALQLDLLLVFLMLIKIDKINDQLNRSLFKFEKPSSYRKPSFRNRKGGWGGWDTNICVPSPVQGVSRS